MKRRIRITALLLIIILGIELVLDINIQAEKIVLKNNNRQTLIVDKNGDGDYKTIEEAITNAQPYNTVYIKKGEYNEIIEIKKQISLIGEDKNSTLISTISEKNKYAIHLGAPEIKIQSLSIKNGAPGLYSNGISITSPKTEIRDCYIYDTPVGIAIWTSNNIIENCIFMGCKDEGIALIGSSYSDCNNNKIINCVFTENCDGIELQYSSNNKITNCKFYNNRHAGIDAITSSNNKNIISNCKIYNNDVYGIYLSSSSNNKIIDCLISNNIDGNIVMNKYSENNQIIFNSESNSKDKKLNKRDALHNFLNRWANSNLQKIHSFLRFLTSF